MGTDPRKLDADAKAFLDSVFPAPFDDSVAQHFTAGHISGDEEPCLKRPHVTLTFAQSADAKIAGQGGRQLPLSGEASFIMTHRMRVMHDGILIGVGTLLNDDPQLNARKLPHPPGVGDLPAPIILDSSLRSPLSAKVLANFLGGTGAMPLLLCTEHGINSQGALNRLRKLSKGGYNVSIIGGPRSSETVDWAAAFQHLYRMGHRRIMIEGGASVIQSLLSAALSAKERKHQLIDSLIITVAPKLVGPKGVAYHVGGPSEAPDLKQSSFLSLPGLVQLKSQMFGNDVVFAWGRGPD